MSSENVFGYAFPPTSFDICGTGQIGTVQEHDNPNSTEMAMEV